MTPSIADLIDELSALLASDVTGDPDDDCLEHHLIRRSADALKSLQAERDEYARAIIDERADHAARYAEAMNECNRLDLKSEDATVALTAAQETIGRYREALRPFAEAMEGHGDIDLKRDRLDGHVWEHPIAMDVTLGDFAIARKALETEGAER